MILIDVIQINKKFLQKFLLKNSFLCDQYMCIGFQKKILHVLGKIYLSLVEIDRIVCEKVFEKNRTLN